MDDKPVIEYHPFGYITIHFDDQSIRLRRCRLGDLEFAKNLLEEKRAEQADLRQSWVDEIGTIRKEFTDLPDPLPEELAEELRGKIRRMNDLAGLLDVARVEIIYSWLAPVIVRMGDGQPPVREDWPVEMFDPNTPNNVIEHWQTRPLASGRLNPNGATAVPVTSPLSPPTVSSPPGPPPR